jgi:sugar transferase (PEP-CTERM system associated)
MRIKLLGHYVYAPVLVLAMVEALAILLAHFTAARFFPKPGEPVHILCASGLLVVICSVLWLLTMGLYCQRLRQRLFGVMLRVTLGLMLGGLTARAISLLVLDDWIPGTILATSVLISWFLLAGTRAVANNGLDEDFFKSRVLVLGAGRRAARLLKLRRRADRRGFKIVAFVAMPGDTPSMRGPPVIELSESLLGYARSHGIREIIVAMDDRRNTFPFRALLDCRMAGIGVSEIGTFLERETGKVFLDAVDPSWLIFSGGFKHSVLRRLFDRSFDLIASGTILLFGAPLMLLVVLAIKIEDGWRAPTLYRQERVGQHGRVFSVMKFRSMRVNAEQDGIAQWAQPNDSRVTKVGAFIRTTRLDELPQLLNVLRGVMSFVGPRPERPSFVTRLGEEIPYYAERHSVKPGITGWAQLCYPYGASDQDAVEKLQYDLFYVKHRGLMFDMMILLQTVEVILFGKGSR